MKKARRVQVKCKDIIRQKINKCPSKTKQKQKTIKKGKEEKQKNKDKQNYKDMRVSV